MATPNVSKRFGLGKGLESLLPSKPAAGTVAEISAAATPAVPAGETNSEAGKALEIDIEIIDRNPYQTRSNFDEVKLGELADSIAASGVVQPIVVKRAHNFAQTGRYTLITGERRLMASKKAGLATIPAVVREATNAQTMVMTIIENLQREDLNPMEQARAYLRLSHDFMMTQEHMAQRTGKGRASVGNFLRLLKLPEYVQRHVEAGQLSFGHARALLALESADAIMAAAKKVLSQQMSVRATENYVQGLLNPEPKLKPEKTPQPVDPNVREAQEQLQRALGLKVTIEDKQGKGKVTIEYGDVVEFDTILEALGKTDGKE